MVQLLPLGTVAPEHVLAMIENGAASGFGLPTLPTPTELPLLVSVTTAVCEPPGLKRPKSMAVGVMVQLGWKTRMVPKAEPKAACAWLVACSVMLAMLSTAAPAGTSTATSTEVCVRPARVIWVSPSSDVVHPTLLEVARSSVIGSGLRLWTMKGRVVRVPGGLSCWGGAMTCTALGSVQVSV
ncbi:MAG TPA: hypothetical protein PLV68_17775, partial [Ilumatobacteraceae bacterium]|nr:hypothetical protein [Ilumatobacteraceae bacterium]